MNFGKILSTARVLLRSELFVKLQNQSWQTLEKKSDKYCDVFSSKLTWMFGRMDGALHFLVEIELKMATKYHLLLTLIGYYKDHVLVPCAVIDGVYRKA